MGLIAEKLKKFYVNNGGEASAVNGTNKISSVLDKIADLSIGGGTSDKFVVTYSNENDEWHTDKTFEQISNAISEGKNVIAKLSISGLFSEELTLISGLSDDVYAFHGFLFNHSGTSMALLAVLIGQINTDEINVEVKSVNLSEIEG